MGLAVRIRFRKFLLFALLGASVWFLLHAVSQGRILTVYFLDVGQGDAAFIIFPCGRNMLVDAGDARQNNTDIPNFLRTLGVRGIDAVVLSHAHADHAGGLKRILREFPAGVFIEPGHEHTTDVYLNLLEFVLQEGIPYQRASRGDSVEGFKNVEINFLGPPDNFYGGESVLNNNSAVMLVTYGQSAFLFTGDIERRAENDIVRIYGNSIASDVLKVPHHGSASSSTPDFISAVNPDIAVISSGRDNPFGHPHPSVIERLESSGARVLRTDADGTIRVRTDGRWIRAGGWP